MASYQGKILEVNLTTGTIGESIVEKDVLRKYIGGSGLAAKLFFDRVSPDVEPLSADNTLFIMTGPMSGTAIPGGARFTVCAKSPLTNIWGETSSGGTFAAWLRSAGYDGISVTGSSDKPVYLHVEDGKAEIKDAAGLWGKGTYDTIDDLREQNGGKSKASVICIGQAGEKQVRFAGIANEKRDHAARCGLGAVMGSKKLKAVVAVGSGKPDMASPDAFSATRKTYAENAKGHFIADIYKTGGTNGALDFGAVIGDLPGKNWTKGDMSDYAPKIGGGVLNGEQFFAGTDQCHGCLIGCKRVVKQENSPYPLKATAGPEYEGVASLGSLLLIGDMAAVIKMNEMCNDYGLDSISTGAVIATAMDCLEQGLISTSDTDGIDLQWGNIDAVIKMIDKIAAREGFGDILADGAKRAAAKIGKNAADYAVEVKGLEVPMHDPRAFHGLGLSYAVGIRGACHTNDLAYIMEQGIVNWPGAGLNPGYEQKSSVGKAEMVRLAQNVGQLTDSATLCYLLMPIITEEEFVTLLSAASGFDYTLDELTKAGERIWMLKRGLNSLMGMTAADDRLPHQILKPPPDGGAAGSVPDLQLMLKEFYELRGLDSNGRPNKDKLESLELGKLAAKL